MRILVVLILSGAAVWAFLKLFPASHAGAPDNHASGTPAAVEAPSPPEQAAGTPRRDGLQSGRPGARGDQVPSERPPESASAAGTGRRDEPRERLTQVEGSPFARATIEAEAAAAQELELAASLAHGDDQRALTLAARELDAGRATALRAFLEAMGGSRDSAEERAVALGRRDDVPARMKQLVAASLGAASFPLPPTDELSPLERAMEMRLFEAAGGLALQRGSYAESSRHLGRLLELEIDAAWPLSPASMQAWSDQLHQAQRRHRWSEHGDWSAVEATVGRGDTLIAIRRRVLDEHPELKLSTGLIARSNGMDFDEYLREGQVLRIPTEPVRVLVDVGARWMLFWIGDEVVESFQVGVGRPGHETITGLFQAGTKTPEPPWWPAGREPVAYGDPDNPLGTRWIGWRVPGELDDTSYGFHGTWEPETIGTASSDGCVRLRNERVELLFEILPVGAEVVVRP